MSKYTVENIQYLEPRQHLRLRVEKYIEGRDITALHYLIWELVDKGIEAYYRDQCNQISVTLMENNAVCIEDNANGLRMFDDHGQPALEADMTTRGFGWDIERVYRVQGGLHGILDYSGVNAISSQLAAEIKRDGYIWTQSYAEGKATTEVNQVRAMQPDENTGTKLTFTPDFGILDKNDFDYERMATRFEEIACLCSGLKIHLIDKRAAVQKESIFEHVTGLADLVAYTNRDSKVLHKPYTQKDLYTFVVSIYEYLPIEIEVGFQYTEGLKRHDKHYVATVEATGGAHYMPRVWKSIAEAIYTVSAHRNIEPTKWSVGVSMKPLQDSH